MDGYKPPLLSLQDMLNLSDTENEDDNWSSNPYNISNFFEPIVSPTKLRQGQGHINTPGTAGSTSGVSSYSTSYSAPVFSSLNPLDGIGSSAEDFGQSFPSHSEGGGGEGCPVVNVKFEPDTDPISNPEHEDGNEDDGKLEDETFDMLDIFDEGLVTSEQRQADKQSSQNNEYDLRALKQEEAEIVIPDIISPESSPLKSPTKSPKKKGKTFPRNLEEQSHQQSKGPSLRMVDTAVDDMKAMLGQNMEKKYRKEAIGQLNALINSLKRYSNLLQDFLRNGGDMILEQYNAKTMLRGILPDINESADNSHPFYESIIIKQALVSHMKGKTFLSTMPIRTAYLWKGSDLLLLQKTILESIIHKREFFLNCRYTDLLTEMGFDTEDLQRLGKCETKQAELGMMKIILNDHDFFSKLKGSPKKPIQTMFIRNNLKPPRVIVLPSPSQLVEDKWNALRKIRQETVLANIEDKNIDWLYVLKYLAEKNVKLGKIEEATCKRTYDHLISSKYNNNSWNYRELLELKGIRDKYRTASWEKVAKLLKTNRTPFSCFIKHRMHCVKYKNNATGDMIPSQQIHVVKDYFDECLGNVAQVDYMLSRDLKKPCAWVSPRRLSLLAQRSLNPRRKHGKFSLVEDALLLVAMEKYKDYLLENDGGIKPIAYALPWRYSTCWRMRFSTLLMTLYSKNWTYENDQLLWRLVQENGPNYKIIQRHLPHKDRKQCRNRYQYLMKMFETTTLEDIHLVYRGWGSRELRIQRFIDIMGYLDITTKSKLCGNTRFVRNVDLEFLKLRRKPTEHNLEAYMMTFPTDVLIAASNRLACCVAQIKSKWEHFKDAAKETSRAEFMSGFDRRTFDPHCPISVASALHYRNAKLIPEEMLENKTEFEVEIFTSFKYFSFRGKAKRLTRRTGIPTLDKLRQLPSISRLIEQPISIYMPGQPSQIVSIKTELRGELEIERLNQAIYQELEDKKKGGRLKGSKRWRTHVKETRKRAARIRWQNQNANNQNCVTICDSDVGIDVIKKENIPYDDDASDFAESPYWDQMSSPCTPATPASIVSTCTNMSCDSVGTGPSMRNTVVGVINDHSYVTPMSNPNEMSSLPLVQLFAKMDGRKVAHAKK